MKGKGKYGASAATKKKAMKSAAKMTKKKPMKRK